MADVSRSNRPIKNQKKCEISAQTALASLSQAMPSINKGYNNARRSREVRERDLVLPTHARVQAPLARSAMGYYHSWLGPIASKPVEAEEKKSDCSLFSHPRLLFSARSERKEKVLGWIVPSVYGVSPASRAFGFRITTWVPGPNPVLTPCRRSSLELRLLFLVTLLSFTVVCLVVEFAALFLVDFLLLSGTLE